MNTPFEERRRQPRIRPADRALIALPILLDVELLDISLRGVLFATAVPVHKGQRAHLRTLLRLDPFTTMVEIRRVSGPSGSSGRYHVGAIFTSLGEDSRRIIQRFLRSIDEHT